jgi:ribosome-binding factor A
MSSNRNLRVAQAIREVVDSAVLLETADPRIRSVTVLRAEVSADLRNATVYVSVMGSQAEQARALQGLKHAAGFLQSKVAERLQTRFTPVLAFKLDDSVKKSVAMSRLIDEVMAADQKHHQSADEASLAPERTVSPNESSGGELPSPRSEHAKR